MKPVAYLQFLQLAQPAVELFENSGVRFVVADADVLGNAATLRERDDFSAKAFRATRIGARGLEIFVHQRLQIAHWAVAFRTCQRRREMIDDDRLRATFGLTALARVIDDERVDVRHGTEHGLGEALF